LNRILRPALLATTVVAACATAAFMPVTAAPTTAAPALRAIARQPLPAPTDRFIVTFRDGAPERGNAASRQHLLDAVGRQLGVRIDHGRSLASGGELLRTGRLLDAHDAKRLLLALRRHPDVAHVELDRLHRPLSAPNDPLFPLQTYLMKDAGGIGLDRAWDRGTGAGVVVAVLDSGITAHPDLDANVLAGGYDFITDPAVATDGNGRDADPTDTGDWTSSGGCLGFEQSSWSTWHGTAVAGVVAAVSDNAIGVAGAAPSARVLPVRVLGKCGGYTSDIADAIVWSAGGAVPGVPANLHPAEVINLSLGAPGACDATLQAAVAAAHQRGAVVVAAAGEGMMTNLDSLAPGNCDGVVSVGKLQDTGYGNALDLLAPYYVQTTTNAGTTTPGAPTYGTGYGSSFSAALVSSTLAVMQGIRPQSPDAVVDLLRATGQDACSAGECAVKAINADAATLALRTPTLVAGGYRTVAEGSAAQPGTIEYIVHLTRPVTTPVTFTALTVDGTAKAGIDYVALPPTTYTIAPGATSTTVHLATIGDDQPEAQQKNFQLRFQDAMGAALATYPADVGIYNDDGDTWLDPSRTDIYAYRGNFPGQYPDRFVFEAPPGATDVTVKLTEAFDGDPDLYVRKGAPPTLDTYDCAANGPELDETCNLGATSGLHYVWVPLNGAFLANVQVSWHLPTTLTVDDVRFEEHVGNEQYMIFKVVRTPVSDSTVTFSAAVAAGTATAGSDFLQPTYSTVQKLYPNQPSREFRVRVYDDTVPEPNETLTLTLSNIVGATIADPQATATILNDDGPTLVVEDARVTEGDAGTKLASVDVVLSQPATDPITFDLATADGSATEGVDYTAASWGAQTLPAGEVRKTFTFPVIGDTSIEYDEDVGVVLSNASVSIRRDRAAVTLANDDGPQLSVGNASITEGDAGTKVATVTVQLSGPSLHPVRYTARTGPYTALAGSDYSHEVVTGWIPAGMLAQTFQFAILGDTQLEADESLRVLLSDPVNATLGDAVGSVTILNDDQPAKPGLAIADATLAEGNSGTTLLGFTATLTQASATPVTFTARTQGVSATSGSDFAALASTITIPAGELSKTFTVAINGDTTIEADETFYVNLSSASGATLVDGQALGTIANDDAAGLRIADTRLVEGQSGTRTMTFAVTLTQLANAPVTFSARTQGNTAIAGNDFVSLPATAFTIPTGQLSKIVSVTINSDRTVEPDETLFVNLSGVSGAVLLDGQGVGTIANDD
jgi:serine protease